MTLMFYAYACMHACMHACMFVCFACLSPGEAVKSKFSYPPRAVQGEPGLTSRALVLVNSRDNAFLRGGRGLFAMVREILRLGVRIRFNVRLILRVRVTVRLRVRIRIREIFSAMSICPPDTDLRFLFQARNNFVTSWFSVSTILRLLGGG